MKSVALHLKSISEAARAGSSNASVKIKQLVLVAANAAGSQYEIAKGRVVSLAEYGSAKAAEIEAAIHDPKTEAALDDFLINRIETKKIVLDRLNRGNLKTRVNSKLAYVLGHTGSKGTALAVAVAKAAGRRSPATLIAVVKTGADLASTILHLIECRRAG